MSSETLTTVQKKHNFSAGPAILPREVLEEASRGVLNHHASGLSILEISHRGKQFVEVIEEARARVKQLMGLGDDYVTLFLQGGASMQFAMLPFNFLPENGTAGYLDTGNWSAKAIKEARLFGGVHLVGSSKEEGYTYIPKNLDLPERMDYLHITSNNTIYGTQIHDFPKVDCPLVVDMSSDIFSRQIDFSQFDFIYAGAQKNLGPAGATVVVVKKELLERTVDRKIPSMLDYRVHVAKDSMFNTPPAFAVYVVGETLKWIEKAGLDKVEADNRAKASALYKAIDDSAIFKGVAKEEDRSLMNVTFVLKDDSGTEEFLKLCDEAGIVGVKGYRTVGGFRASIYNALRMESVQVLIDAMQHFEKTKG